MGGKMTEIKIYITPPQVEKLMDLIDEHCDEAIIDEEFTLLENPDDFMLKELKRMGIEYE